MYSKGDRVIFKKMFREDIDDSRSICVKKGTIGSVNNTCYTFEDVANYAEVFIPTQNLTISLSTKESADYLEKYYPSKQSKSKLSSFEVLN